MYIHILHWAIISTAYILQSIKSLTSLCMCMKDGDRQTAAEFYLFAYKNTAFIS